LLAILYYSIVLTAITVIVAICIGTIKLLSLIAVVANPTGKFWDGVNRAGDNFEIIGGAICGSFIVFGTLSIILYRPWRNRVDWRRRRVNVDGAELPGIDNKDTDKNPIAISETSREVP
jgi:nickel/cobalt transporter (NiCoT) family protein